jgi:ATP-dependent DNA ligase
MYALSRIDATGPTGIAGRILLSHGGIFRGISKITRLTIRYSETFNVPLSELMKGVRKHQLEGIVAKRAGSQYRSGERSADWLKRRANRGHEFVIGGYVPNANILDSLLIGYYDGRDLMYAGSVRAGMPLEFRRVLPPNLEELRIPRCPFVQSAGSR